MAEMQNKILFHLNSKFYKNLLTILIFKIQILLKLFQIYDLILNIKSKLMK